MICKNCGNEMPEGTKFCGKCGALMGAAPVQGTETADLNAGAGVKKEAAAPVSPAPGKKGKKLLCGGIIGIAVLLVCVAAFILNSDSYLYKRACAYYEEGNYAKAEKVFSRITDYRDSKKGWERRSIIMQGNVRTHPIMKRRGSC